MPSPQRAVNYHFTHNKPAKKGMISVTDEPCAIEMAWKSVFATQTFVPDFPWKHIFDAVHLIASDFADFGLKVVRNMVHNATLDLRDGTACFGRYLGEPAIVCGAGPSLDLEAIAHSNVLTIACGTAMDLLDHYHFGAAVDPENCPAVSDRPLFFEPRVAHTLLSKWTGDRLCLAGLGMHPIERWLYREQEGLETGWNAGCFGVAVAKKLGCSPIYVTGMDGELKKGQRYYGQREGTKEDKDLKMGLSWISGVHSLPKEGVPSQWTLKYQKPPKMPVHQLPKAFVDSVWFNSLVLEPNWEIWKHVFARELDTSDASREAFFMRIREEYRRGL